MKDRLLSFSGMMQKALCVLAMGGLMYSCSDDYDLPDKTPSWLGSSIYQYLKDQGNYTNTVKLIDDLDYAEVLGKTGSKTLFVADDDAYNEFYKNNNWGVSGYNQLSQSQKKLLLNSSMLDNAYLLENLPHATSGSYQNGSYLNKNVCMKHITSLAATDSIAFYNWDSDAIPSSYNPDDADYWARFKTQAKGGITLATDATVPMMMHWVNGFMENNKITDADFATIVGKERSQNDVYIYGSKVIGQDVTCQNGYIDKLDRVMEPAPNMAELIHTNGHTSVFSHMMNRFSAPYYNSSLTNAYRQLNPAVDSVFEKRYISDWSQGGSLTSSPDGQKLSYYLTYDPEWNTYYPLEYQYSASLGRVTDMATIFAPSDQALLNYFSPSGGGAFLMERYAKELPVTAENLVENIDQVPLNVIQALVNNLMKNSFVASVPSKYLNIMNDARDPMFSDVSSLDAYKALIDTCLIANNGVVYVINKTYTPATYACVAAPCLVSDSLHVFKWGIFDDEKWLNNPGNAHMNFMSVVLKAMNSNFSLFAPTDGALHTYYDPVSMMYTQPYVLGFTYNATDDNVTAKARRFDVATGEVSSVNMATPISSDMIYNRLIDLLDTHIFVHTSEEAAAGGVQSGKEYFISRTGAPVKITNGAAGADGMTAQGGWQFNYDQTCHVTKIYDQTRETNGYGNGKCYVTDRPLQTTTKSVYAIMKDNDAEDSPYREFFDLCQVDADVLTDAGFADDYIKQTDKQRALSRYFIFSSSNPCLDYNVRFFSTYNYTVFIPDNESVRDAIDERGLPTWESIRAYITEKQTEITDKEGDPSFNVDSATAAYKTVAKAMATSLVNFCKYYFMDQSKFADVTSLARSSYETSCINNETNRYFTVDVASSGNHTLTVYDNVGNERNVVDGHYNLLARDLQYNATGRNALTISTSSYAVLHLIDGVLNYKTLTNGRYDSDWATPGAAKAYLAKYRITK